ncbi:lipopolysaccharide biosynthesis protein [Azospirillum rugosum]|uniref:O-antigen/teichoic acid export membrane protein n=1 Tax=Azospirillum rugosum TaxID=416170 RepID=A0ABS4SMA1_9PROT|nr:oligosaccharide flippase family protein [Azospirillum rugosum]MBP2293686.1 O-antigen/teichoic acid export membrane protein [Azospirillum rugosum]MDQ0527231.1 O-antigen/teichoic acid export membrane protein [Azospirillum rugosum]
MMRPRNWHSLARYATGLGLRGVEVAGKLGLYIVAARSLGAHDAGLFFLCLTWIGLGSTVARLGLERAITRHLAAELAVGRGRAAGRDLRTALVWTGAASAGAALVTAAVAGPASHLLFGAPDLEVPLRLSAAALVPQTLTITVGYALAGLKRGVAAQFVQNALWPVLTLAALLAGVDSVEGILLTLAAVLAFSFLVGMAFLARDRGQFADGPEAQGQAADSLPSLWHTAMPLFVVELVQVSLASLPVLALGVFVDAASVGAFSVANRISMLIWVVIISIGTFASPAYAELHRRGEMDRLRAMNRRVMLTVAALGSPLVLAMMAAPETLLTLVGPGFGIAATALVILAAGQLVNCLMACQDILLAMTGQGQALRRLNLLQLASCIVLGAVLIPSLGMTGAALVTALTVAQGAVGTTLKARNVLSSGLSARPSTPHLRSAVRSAAPQDRITGR